MEIQLLGNVEIRGCGRTHRLSTSSGYCVLAALALQPRTPIPAATLIDWLWLPSQQTDKSLDSLARFITEIRGAIEEAGGDRAWLRYAGGARTYCLDIDASLVDYHRFTILAATARRDADIEMFDQALALWRGRGEPLANVKSLWADRRRTDMKSAVRTVRHHLFEALLAAGQPERVIQDLAYVVEESPTDEFMVDGLRALAAAGRHVDILEWTTRLTRLMDEVFGAAPAPASVALAQRLTAGSAEWTPTALAGWRSADAKPSAMFSMRSGLPHFTGRQSELDTLAKHAQAVLDGQPRAVNLHAVSGMAGVGKTTVCIRAAHLLEDLFPGGNLFLELHGHTPGRAPVPPGDALDSLLLATGMDLSTLPPKLDDRARVWRQRINGARALLIFDDAADHDQVRPLMPGSPSCLVLITSRHRLVGLEGVAPMALHPMPPEDARQLLLRSADRVGQLDDDHAVAEIVGRFCGHLPMAISIVGARLRDHPRWDARHIADQLADDHERLNGLQAGDLSVPGAFAMSFRAMPADRRHLFQLLGVHPGPEFDAYAVAALLDRDRAAASRGLDDLYADNLIMETTPGRYQMHDLLRDYAITMADDLTATERHHALDRVLNYYLHAALAANSQLPRFQALPASISSTPVAAPSICSAVEACQWFAAELSTLTTCATHAAAAGEPHRAVHLSAALSSYLRVMSLTDQAVRLHNTALAAATRIDDRLGQGYALNYLGAVQRLRGELDAAEDNHRRALELFEQAADELGQGYALNDLGRVQRLRGELDAAEHSHRRALELFVQAGDQSGQGNALNYLGRLLRFRGVLGAAEDNHRRALELFEQAGDRLGQGNAHNNLGRVRQLRGELDAAERNHRRALDLLVQAGDRLGQGYALNDLGRVQRFRGELDAAEDNHRRALELFEQAADELGQGYVLNDLAHAQRLRGELDAAEHNHQRAVELLEQAGDRLGQGYALNDLGRVQRLRGELDAAERNHQCALELFGAAADLGGEAETLNSLGELALDRSVLREARSYFGRAHAIARDIGSARREADALSGQGRCLVGTDIDAGIVLLHQALAIYRSCNAAEAVRIEEILATLGHRDTAVGD